MARKDPVREIVSRRDPQGYYVIPAKREALEVLKDLRDLEAEEAGTHVILRTKSRRRAEEVARILLRRGLLEPP